MMRVIIVGDTGIKDAVISAPFTDGTTPVLFVQKDAIPSGVSDEIIRLAPDEIIVFGGTARVSQAVVAALQAYAPTTRIAGASVFGTAIAASQILNPIEAPTDPPAPTPPPTPPGSGDWGDGIAFGDRPPQDNVLHLNGEVGGEIDGLFFDGTQDSEFTYMSGRSSNAHVCILLTNCRDITIRNVDFKQVSQPIAIFGGSNIRVEWNRADGITGPSARVGEQTGNFIQTVNSPSGVNITDNKIIGGDTEDIISLFSANQSEVARNQIDGTGWTSGSGTGIIMGDGGGNELSVHHNTLLNPGQVGLASPGGFNNMFEDNIVYSDHDRENTAAYYWDYDRDGLIGGGGFRNNRAKFVRGGGLWNPAGGIDEGNNWDDDSIDPADLAVVL